jgi:hypothetical protein
VTVVVQRLPMDAPDPAPAKLGISESSGNWEAGTLCVPVQSRSAPQPPNVALGSIASQEFRHESAAAPKAGEFAMALKRRAGPKVDSRDRPIFQTTRHLLCRSRSRPWHQIVLRIGDCHFTVRTLMECASLTKRLGNRRSSPHLARHAR